MRNGKPLGFPLLALLVFGCAALSGHAQDAEGRGPNVSRCEGNVELRISVPQNAFDLGRSVPLRVEIQNCSQKEVWIALSHTEELGFPVNLPLTIRDKRRRRVLPNTYRLLESPFGRGPHEWWVRLPPGYLYGREVILTKYESAFVDVPGKYDITMSYTGIARPYPSSKPLPEPVNAPPEGANVFIGRVESNSIAVEIVAPANAKPLK